MPERMKLFRVIHLFLAGLLMLGLAACGSGSYQPDAVGKEGEITIVIDSTRWQGPVGDAIRETVGELIGTLPAPERSFDLRQVTLESQGMLDRVTTLKNLVFVAVLSDSTNEARFMRSRLGEGAAEAIRERGGAAVYKENVWRRGQQVAYVTAETPEELIRTLQQEGQSLRYVFNEITRTRVREDMFDRGRQQDLEALLMERHGFAVNVQHDYVIAKDTLNTIWLRRVLPDTWRGLLVHYWENADPSLLAPEWIYRMRDSLAREYLQGNLGDYALIDRRRPLETENINFIDRYGFETRGLWYMVSEAADGSLVQNQAMGGPFVTYAFYDEPSARIYLIDGMVFAPGYEKREFLRQMEVIAYTFRTAAQAAPRAEVATVD